MFELNENELKLLEKVSKITSTDYVKDCDRETLFCAIEDLIYCHENLEEEITDLQTDIEENYTLKHFDPYDEYGISRNDFI